jgi:hypothetical protein
VKWEGDVVCCQMQCNSLHGSGVGVMVAVTPHVTPIPQQQPVMGADPVVYSIPHRRWQPRADHACRGPVPGCL